MATAAEFPQSGQKVPNAPADSTGPTSRRDRIIRLSGLLMVLVALGSATYSFFVLTGQTTIDPSPDVVRTAWIVNGIVVFCLALVIGYEIYRLIEARQRRRAAARLHVRIVALFSVIAALPAILTALVASITLDKGLDRWFSERTVAIVETSRSVAQAYVEEHSRIIAIDLVALAGEFDRVSPDLERNRDAIAAFLTNQGNLRGLSAISLLRGDRSRIVDGDISSNLAVPPPPADIFKGLEDGQPALIAPGRTNLVGGVIRLTSFDDTYLYMVRPIDPKVTRYVRLTDENADEYRQLVDSRFGVQVAFAILFVGMALVVLLSAIWIGLGFADRLVEPVRQLISAAAEISSGNLDVRVPARRSTGDIALLADTFNTMSSQLKSQRDDLLSANAELTERRLFIEAMLSGVSAGVIGLDADNRITLANRSAADALKLHGDDIVGQPIGEVLPELDELIEAAGQSWRSESRGQIRITRDGDQRTLNIQITRESGAGGSDGLVVTLDDITDLVSAQRRSAWADVARRIAHEIKNPLTPIQLSAERLRRRYTPKIADDDRKVFDQCTETIVRQVGDIRRMVDEFSSFARMPKPVMEARDLADVVKEAVFLQEVGNPDITFALDLPEKPATAPVDHRLVTQAMTNIVKNATEAIEAVPAAEQGDGGRILVRVRETEDAVTVDVEDNGKGLPASDRESLLEPYMTTREKGTGLGLAIVRKIMEEHDGSIALLDRQVAAETASKTAGGKEAEQAKGRDPSWPRGACVRLVFPKHPGGGPTHAAAAGQTVTDTVDADRPSASDPTASNPVSGGGEPAPPEPVSGEQGVKE